MGKFVKGQSGNPGGRAKGLERIVRETIESYSEEGPDGVLTGWEVMTRRLVGIVMKGDDKDSIAAYKLLAERVYGRAKESVDMTVTDITDEHRAALRALRMTPHERRQALAQDTTEEEAPPVETDGLGDF